MNTAHFAGRLGRDADMRYTPAGDAVANFSLAVDVYTGGEKKALWVDCSLWGKRAESLGPYLLKGTACALQGTVGLRQFESHGEHRAVLTCNVREITLLGGGSTGEAERAPTPTPPRDEIEDDIPF